KCLRASTWRPPASKLGRRAKLRLEAPRPPEAACCRSRLHSDRIRFMLPGCQSGCGPGGQLSETITDAATLLDYIDQKATRVRISGQQTILLIAGSQLVKTQHTAAQQQPPTGPKRCWKAGSRGRQVGFAAHGAGERGSGASGRSPYPSPPAGRGPLGGPQPPHWQADAAVGELPLKLISRKAPVGGRRCRRCAHLDLGCSGAIPFLALHRSVAGSRGSARGRCIRGHGRAPKKVWLEKSCLMAPPAVNDLAVVWPLQEPSPADEGVVLAHPSGLHSQLMLRIVAFSRNIFRRHIVAFDAGAGAAAAAALRNFIGTECPCPAARTALTDSDKKRLIVQHSFKLVGAFCSRLDIRCCRSCFLKFFDVSRKWDSLRIEENEMAFLSAFCLDFAFFHASSRLRLFPFRFPQISDPVPEDLFHDLSSVISVHSAVIGLFGFTCALRTSPCVAGLPTCWPQILAEPHSTKRFWSFSAVFPSLLSVDGLHKQNAAMIESVIEKLNTSSMP
uniref:Zn(2)-C6 fungal-type domain-containing protein n=1 Tax=Macrostomum lignano TaxID=282301 RepID=A0A1I8F7S1_9PLAT